MTKELEFSGIKLEFHSKTPRFLGVQILKIFEKKLEIEKPRDSSHDERTRVIPRVFRILGN